ncbi:NACHT domain-containing protein [Streptomyces sp. NPDC017529]|uniref:NACHT domain-containing protein n=1 Tax=Streptomyces sp. NPDC017529 TaxID=3365000 RepID=UPI003798F4B7
MSIVASVVFAVWHIVNDGELDSADTTTLLGLPVAVIGLVIAVVALRKPFEGDAAELARSRAGKLARQVTGSEGRVWRQLLGADIQRINLTYALCSVSERAAIAPSAGRTFTDGPAALPDVLDYYRSTHPHRLVITGEAGAGKTVLALELILALIDSRADDDPVPVRVSLAQWDTDQPLATLLAQQLAETYGWPSAMAADLVDHGLVLPVLDGLDEMDPLRPDGAPDPEAPRARAALEALNAYQNGRDAGPLVLTCRTAHYDALAPASRLMDAARITIDPVSASRAISYLRDRARDASRWQPLIEHLRGHPHSPLAAILSTPWRLCLTATVYHRDGDPSELLGHHTGDDLDRHLLARYLPAATANTPNPRHYKPEDIHRWLHHLTGHLDGAATGTPSTDIALHQLWPLAGTLRVRAVDLLLTALPITLPFLLVVDASNTGGAGLTGAEYLTALFVGILAYRPTPKPSRLSSLKTIPPGFLARISTGFMAWFPIGFAVGSMYGFVYFADFTADLMVGSGAGFLVGLVGGLMGGLAGGFRTGYKTWFTVWSGAGAAVVVYSWLTGDRVDELGGIMDGIAWLIIGVTGGLAGGVVRGLRGEPTTVANPRAIIRDDMVYGMAIGPLTGCVACIMVTLMSVALVWGRSHGDRTPTALMVSSQDVAVVGLVAGIAAGLLAGLARAARRYGVFLLCSRGKLPFRLGPFLDWAVTAGLLRYNGPAYQFRHRELQDWLAHRPHP